jgi:hypothetical protein
MAHPVLALGVTGGHAVPVDHFPAAIAADTRMALEWQVIAWREWHLLRADHLQDPRTEGILRGLVLPALLRAAEKYAARGEDKDQQLSRLSRFWNRGVAVVAHAAAGVVQMVMANPLVMTVAVILSELVHSVMCLMAFGSTTALVENALESLRQWLDPQWRLLHVCIDLIKTAYSCVFGGLALVECAWKGLKGMGYIGTILLEMAQGMVEGVRGLFDKAAGSLWPNLQMGIRDLSQGENVDALGPTLIQNLRNLLDQAANVFGTVLLVWLTRSVSLDALRRWLDVMVRHQWQWIQNMGTKMVHLLEHLRWEFEKLVPGGFGDNTTLHDLVVITLREYQRAQKGAEQLVRLLRTLQSITECMVVWLYRHLRQLVGLGGDAVDPNRCCTAALVVRFQRYRGGDAAKGVVRQRIPAGAIDVTWDGIGEPREYFNCQLPQGDPRWQTCWKLSAFIRDHKRKFGTDFDYPEGWAVDILAGKQ